MALPNKPERSPVARKSPFECDWAPAAEALAAPEAILLIVRALRSIDAPGRTKRRLHLKQRERGVDESAYAESLLALNALGGERLEDSARLREDAGLAGMVGHAMPSPEAAREFLYQSHGESRSVQAQRELPVGQVSYLPGESAPPPAPAQVNQDLAPAAGRRCAEQRIVTLDLNAAVIGN